MGDTSREIMRRARQQVPEWTPAQVNDALAQQHEAKPDNQEVVVVDVREKREWNEGYITGAIHVPRGFLELQIEEAEASGKLTHDSILLEPTSGNTGIALAMIARVKGYQFTAVIPDNVTRERRQMLELYGANIIFSDGKLGSNGAVKLAQELARSGERYLMLYQYGNDANPRAHSVVASRGDRLALYCFDWG